MTVTLADVAARAGVSAATVSRVLNSNYPVAGATRERVLRAVAELEYVANGPASALAAATSDLVGILVNDVADPFFGILASAVQSEMGGQGSGGGEKLAVVCNTGGSPERELTYLTLLHRQRAGAVVLTGGAVEDPEHTAALTARLARLAAAGTQVVLCGRPPLTGEEGAETPAGGDAADVPDGGGSGAPVGGSDGGSAVDGTEPDRAARGPLTVAFDNRGGARELTEHLIGLGHRRIGCVAGPEGRTTTRHRLEGHRAALAAHGIEDAPGRTVHGAYDRASGYAAAGELLRRDENLTAVVAANDTVALGVCAALRERGLRVPEDVSVAGFDDLPFSADAVPALTTVRLPLAEAGTLAGRLAMGRATAPPDGVALLSSELVIRDSTAPLYP